MPNAYISGTGFYVPPRVVTNTDLIRQYGIDTSHEWILQRTGIEARRFADRGVATTDMAREAARDAIERSGVAPGDLDMIIFATLSPDFAFPGCGVVLQEKLGLCAGEGARRIPAMDIRNQCSGFLYSLATATAMVQSGSARHVLVVGAEKHSAALDLTTRGRAVSALFGDGAGAAVVSATDADRGVRKWYLGADGRYADALTQKVWDIRNETFTPLDADGWGRISPDLMWAKMDGKTVFKHAVETLCPLVMQACWEHSLGPNDVDLWVFHQANKRLNEYIVETLGLPRERVVHNIERYGNTTAATIPILLAEAEREGRLKPGMKVITAAFGSGFTWGAAVIDW